MSVTSGSKGPLFLFQIFEPSRPVKTARSFGSHRTNREMHQVEPIRNHLQATTATGCQHRDGSKIVGATLSPNLKPKARKAGSFKV